MINVLVKDTNEVLGFPDNTDFNAINSIVYGDMNGEIKQSKPNWYRDKVQHELS